MSFAHSRNNTVARTETIWHISKSSATGTHAPRGRGASAKRNEFHLRSTTISKRNTDRRSPPLSLSALIVASFFCPLSKLQQYGNHQIWAMWRPFFPAFLTALARSERSSETASRKWIKERLETNAAVLARLQSCVLQLPTPAPHLPPNSFTSTVAFIAKLLTRMKSPLGPFSAARLETCLPLFYFSGLQTVFERKALIGGWGAFLQMTHRCLQSNGL